MAVLLSFSFTASVEGDTEEKERRKSWEAVLDMEKIAITGGALIVLTSSVTGHIEALSLGGFLVGVGCAMAFTRKKISNRQSSSIKRKNNP